MKCDNPVHDKGCECYNQVCPDCGQLVVLPHHPNDKPIKSGKYYLKLRDR